MLIITQKVNKGDPVLGFFHDWIIEFAKHESNLTVLCLELGPHSLPSNIEVISLGKEKGYGKIRIIWNFLRVLVTRRYGKVFVHMNPEYIVLGGLWWRFRGTRIALWYTHKAVNLKLRIATFFAHTIFSASQESFRYRTSKLKVVGHGIDSNIFYPSSDFPKNPHIITVGRISPTKNYEPLIDAMEILVQSFPTLQLSIVGGPTSSSDQAYYEIIKEKVFEKKLENNIIFLGPISYEKVPDLYRAGTIFVNLSNTGSLDKAILEAMATGLFVVTSNEAMKTLIDQKYIVSGTTLSIADAIKLRISNGEGIDQGAIDYVREHHSLGVLIKKLDDEFIHPKKRICLFGIYDKNYSRNKILARGFEENGYEVIHCQVNPQEHSFISKYRQLIKEWRKIKHHDFEKIIVAFPGHSVVLLSLFLFPRRKIVFDFFVSLFNSDVEDREKHSSTSFRALYLWLLDFFSLHLAPRILIDTKSHRDFISGKFFVSSSKFRVLPVGSDETIVYPAEKENKETFVVHFHGTNTPLQGFSVILESAKILEDRSDIEFHVYGFFGKDTKNIRYFPRFPYENMSKVLGQADIVLGIFGTTKKAHLVVPNKVFEGLASSRPVITAKTEAIQELFGDTPPMVVCRQGKGEDLAKKIIFLKENPYERESIAHRGFDFFKQNLTPKILISRLIQKRL